MNDEAAIQLRVHLQEERNTVILSQRIRVDQQRL